MNETQELLHFYNVEDTRDIPFSAIEKHIPWGEKYIGYFVSEGILNIITDQSRVGIVKGVIIIHTMFIHKDTL